MIERAVIMSDYKTQLLQVQHLSLDHIHDNLSLPEMKGKDFELIMSELERKVIEDALRENHGNQRATAKGLKISESGLRYKIKRLGLKI